MSDGKLQAESTECDVPWWIRGEDLRNKLPGEFIRLHRVLPLAGRDPLVDYLGEIIKHRGGWQVIARRVVCDVGRDSARGDEDNLDVLVEEVAFHGKSVAH